MQTEAQLVEERNARNAQNAVVMKVCAEWYMDSNSQFSDGLRWALLNRITSGLSSLILLSSEITIWT